MSAGYKYKKIAESLRQRIKNGGFVSGDFLPTTKKLAVEYQTTPVTIDRAIGILVSQGLVVRTPGVGTVVQSPGYPIGGTRHPGYKGSASINGGNGIGGVGMVGALLQAQTESRYWERLLEGVSDILRPNGFATLIGYHNQSHELALDHARLFKQQGVEVILFTPFDRPSALEYEQDNAIFLSNLKDLGFQVIMLDRYINTIPGHFISEYCFAQGKEMVEQIIDRGFKNPLCLSTDYVSVIGTRERSFLEGCKSRSIPNPENRIVHLPLKSFQEKKYDEIIDAINPRTGTDVIVSMNSRIFNTLIYLKAKKVIQVGGGNLKLAGFVDIELMDMEDVIAYVEQPVREMGHAAGRMVIRLLSEDALEFQHSLVPCELRIL